MKYGVKLVKRTHIKAKVLIHLSSHELLSRLKLEEENVIAPRNVYIAKNILIDYEASFIAVASQNVISIPFKVMFDIE